MSTPESLENGQFEAETAISGPFAPENAPISDDGENPPPGRMFSAVERDLAHMPDLDKGVRGSLAELARNLARAMDETGDDKPTPAQVGSLGQQLRTTLLSLDNVAGDANMAQKFFRLMAMADDPEVTDSAPSRDQQRKASPISGLPDDEKD